MRKFLDTGGESLWRGFKNYLGDLAENGGLPSQVDKSRFKLGVNIATTPGAVVFRNELLEVIQYKPMTPEVRKRPVIIAPPQINKFYSLDLSPDKSLVQYLLKSGIQVFCVSWRNPTAKERDWGLDTYVAALDEGTRRRSGDRELGRRDDDGGVLRRDHLRGLCRHGWRARAKRRSRISSRLSASLDAASAGDSAIGPLVTPETFAPPRRRRGCAACLTVATSRGCSRGCGRTISIWNYWVNNYLLGNQPPAFDILFWNADTTSLPARLHSRLCRHVSRRIRFVNANKLTLNGAAIDMSRVKAGRLRRRRRHRPYHPVEGGVSDRQDLR